MSNAWIVKRRPRRPSAMQRHRFIEARVVAGHSAIAFPGTPMPEPAGARERLFGGGLSILLHAALALAFVLLAQIAREEIVEQTIEITLPKPSNDEPAPRPRAIAESSGRFAPAPMALAPQIVNPTVIQQRAPDLSAAQVRVADLQPIQAPRDVVVPSVPEVAQVRAFQSPIVANTAAPRVVNDAAPSLAPVDVVAPAGTLAGPRQVVTGGNTVGITDPTALGTGSSVSEGIASNRDVHGAKTGERASVNVAVGAGGGRGTGGEGLGPGGVSEADCLSRPEVQTYMARLKERVMSRWRSTPTDLPNGTFKVSLRFRLDPSGSASEIQFVSADSKTVGQSAADAMRAASPFDQMPDRARCIASQSWTAAFTLETFASAN